MTRPVVDVIGSEPIISIAPKSAEATDRTRRLRTPAHGRQAFVEQRPDGVGWLEQQLDAEPPNARLAQVGQFLGPPPRTRLACENRVAATRIAQDGDLGPGRL